MSSQGFIAVDRCSGGVKVDGYLRSSDPHIYAVGEVASYEGGMVYGLWKPGTEQAEVRQQQYKAGPCIEDGHPNSNDGNPYNGFINPYYIAIDEFIPYYMEIIWNNGSLDPGHILGGSSSLVNG